MTVFLKEYFSVPTERVRIDRDNGVLFGVKVLGTLSRNRRQYPKDTLQKAMPLYENAKVNFDHPDGDPRQNRSYQDRIGVIRNVHFMETNGTAGLYGDFHFNPKHSLAGQLLWDAEYSPENVGFSHNVEAVVEPENGSDVVKEILAVRSVDLVADPATTKGLFESVAGENDCKDDSDGDKDSKECADSSTAATMADYRGDILAAIVDGVESFLRETGDDTATLLSPTFVTAMLDTCDVAKARRLLEDRKTLLRRIITCTESQTRSLSHSHSPVSREQWVGATGDFRHHSHIENTLESFLRDVKR